MNVEVESSVIEQAPHRVKNRPTYIVNMKARWVQWTDIDDEEVTEAIDYLSGDLFFEMRKLTAVLCASNEKAVEEICNRLDDILPDELKEKARQIVETKLNANKLDIKDKLDASWRDIIDKQKVGLDKISIVVNRHMKQK